MSNVSLRNNTTALFSSWRAVLECDTSFEGVRTLPDRLMAATNFRPSCSGHQLPSVLWHSRIATTGLRH